MLQHYPGQGNPVIKALQGKISPRELRVMLEHLPPGNPLSREFNGPWDNETVLLHAVANGLMRLNANYYNVHRQKGDKPESPDYIENPNDDYRDDTTPEASEAEQQQIKAEQEHLLQVLAKNKQKHQM